MNFLRFYLYTIILHLTLTGSSFVQIGDAVSIKLDSSIIYTSTDNLFRDDSNKQSDDYFTIVPGVDVSFGQNDIGLDFNLGVAYDLIRYNEYDQFDDDLLRFNFSGSSVQNSTLDTNFYFSQSEYQSPRSSFEVAGNPDLIKSTQTEYDLGAEYSYSPKLSFGIGVEGSELKFDTFAHQLAAKESYSIPFDVIYRYSEKLDVVYGITYTSRKVGEITYFNRDSYETDSYYYNIGLRGDMLPKLSGRFSVGYRTLEYSNSNNEPEMLGVKSSLNWMLSPKFKSLISLDRYFDAAGSGDTYEHSRIRVSNSYSINTEYFASLNFTYTEKEYSSRTDQAEYVSLMLYYVPDYNSQYTIGFFLVDSQSLVDAEVEELRLSADFSY
ncbi:MAG: hypothetical protein CL961_00950 [Euryarchaeota archaeon]|nr:hypothetical protein [Euryarchaeota archaeon]